VTVTCRSAEATQALAEGIGRRVRPGTVIALSGDLGAGKTRLVQGLARGLGVDPREVSSPTFVLCHVYDGNHRLLHVDAYRLKSAAEFEELGVLEQLAMGAVLVVEWGEKIAAALPESRIEIDLEEISPTSRRIQISAPPDRASLFESSLTSLADKPT
jgi:tRNA threonylcarbamoyladenosine biosynthesis protein TsaE